MIIVELLLDITVLFFPILFIMIYFIIKYKETIKRIKYYENIFGEVFTKDVMDDMKNIPPECYNFNPAVFVPEYSSSRNNSQKIDFSDILNSEESEAQKE